MQAINTLKVRVPCCDNFFFLEQNNVKNTKLQLRIARV